MDNRAYALATNGMPKIIIWDNQWPLAEGKIVPIFKYAFGVTPKRIVPANANVCPMIVRPEFRLSHNGIIIYSSIVEFNFLLHFLKPGLKPKNKYYLEAINTFVHPAYEKEFLVRTGHNISQFYDSHDKENQDEILRSADHVLKENGWL